jgi:hypothetical protein
MLVTERYPSERAKGMIVIWRNGQRTVITGWRAWLIVLPIMLLITLGAIAIASLLLGIAITLATLFLLGLPLAIGLTILISRFRSLRPR